MLVKHSLGAAVIHTPEVHQTILSTECISDLHDVPRSKASSDKATSLIVRSKACLCDVCVLRPDFSQSGAGRSAVVRGLKGDEFTGGVITIARKREGVSNATR